MGPTRRQRLDPQAEDHRDARQLPQAGGRTLAEALQRRHVLGKQRQDQVDARRTPGLLPELWAAVADIPEQLRAGSHPFPECVGERVERVLRQPDRPEPLVAQGHPEPVVLRRVPPGRGAGHLGNETAEPLATVPWVVDPDHQVAAKIRPWAVAQDGALNVIKL